MALAKTWASIWLELNPVATLHIELLVKVDCKSQGHADPPVLGHRRIKAMCQNQKQPRKGQGLRFHCLLPRPAPHPSHKATHHLPCFFASPLGGVGGFPDQPSRRAEIVNVNN